jgi:integrase
MLRDNGRVPKQRNNYFMRIDELEQLLKYLKKYYDPKWFLFIITQFSLGMRCSECSAINIHDFRDGLKFLDYRQAKTNKYIKNEPVPEPLQMLLKAYIIRNSYRIVDGYLFSNHNGKGSYYTTETIGAFWSKWRRGCAKEYQSEGWLDKYECGRYRISSHSLRRLHRTVLSKKIRNDWMLAQLCHYDDMDSFLRYKNEFEILENADKLILPHINPVIQQLCSFSKGQRLLHDFKTLI